MTGGVRVALLADTHGRVDERIVELVAQCDCAVHAGDIGAAAVLDALRPRGGVVLAVRGNNDVPDKWPAGEGDRLQGLPWEASLELPGGRLVAVHGDRAGPGRTRHAWLRRAYADARAVVYGHSHQLSCDQAQVPWVLNPGAAGGTRTFGGPSCLILHASDARWRVELRRFEPQARPRRSAGTDRR